MGLGAMIYIPRFIKIGSSIQKLIRGDSQTHRQPAFIFQNEESGLKKNKC
jgi:hypothetical protein